MLCRRVVGLLLVVLLLAGEASATALRVQRLSLSRRRVGHGHGHGHGQGTLSAAADGPKHTSLVQRLTLMRDAATKIAAGTASESEAGVGLLDDLIGLSAFRRVSKTYASAGAYAEHDDGTDADAVGPNTDELYAGLFAAATKAVTEATAAVAKMSSSEAAEVAPAVALASALLKVLSQTGPETYYQLSDEQYTALKEIVLSATASSSGSKSGSKSGSTGSSGLESKSSGPTGVSKAAATAAAALVETRARVRCCGQMLTRLIQLTVLVVLVGVAYQFEGPYHAEDIVVFILILLCGRAWFGARGNAHPGNIGGGDGGDGGGRRNRRKQNNAPPRRFNINPPRVRAPHVPGPKPRRVNIVIPSLGGAGGALTINGDCPALTFHEANTVAVDEALIAPLRTCPQLLQLLGLPADSNALTQARFPGAAVIQDVTVGANAPTAWGGNAPAAAAGTVTVNFHPLRRVQAQVWTRAGAADATLVTCAVGVGAGFTYSDAIVAECGRVLLTRVHALQALGVMVNVHYTFALATDVHAVAPATLAGAALAVNTVLQIDEPVLITVLQDVAGQQHQPSHRAWVSRAVCNVWGANLVAALNAAHEVTTAGLAIAGGLAGDALLQHNGAGAVAWGGAIPDFTRAIRVEVFARAAGGGAVVLAHGYFRDVNSAQSAQTATYPQVAQAANIVLNTGGDAVHYLNTASGAFVGVNAASGIATAVQGALATASGVAAGVMTPTGVYTALTTEGGAGAPAGGLSQNLYTAILAQHGAANVHFGYAYFEMTVALRKTIPAIVGERPTKVIGWLCAADNVASALYNPMTNGAGLHTEQRIMEQARRFVRALEVPWSGVTMQVTGIRSRWITDFFPDRDLINNCQFMIQSVNHYAAAHFRTFQYTEDIRLLRQNAYNGAIGAGAIAAAAAANAIGAGAIEGLHAGLALAGGPAIAWTAPFGHYIKPHGVIAHGVAYAIGPLPP